MNKYKKCRIYYEIAQCILEELKFIVVIDCAKISHNAVEIRGMLSNIKYRKDNGRLRDDIHAEGKKILNKMGILNISYYIRKKINNIRGVQKGEIMYLSPILVMEGFE